MQVVELNCDVPPDEVEKVTVPEGEEPPATVAVLVVEEPTDTGEGVQESDVMVTAE